MSFPMARHEPLGIEVARRCMDRVCFVVFSLGLTDCALIPEAIRARLKRALTQNQPLLRTQPL